jgi:hypothetical protein
VTGEDRLELHYAIAIRLGDTTKKSGIIVAEVVSVSVASGDKAGIDTSGVAVPNVPTRISQSVSDE